MSDPKGPKRPPTQEEIEAAIAAEEEAVAEEAPTPDLSGAQGIHVTPQMMSLLMERRLSLWAQFSGIHVDHRKFGFGGHKYLEALFADRSEHIVLMKAAQMGATIYMLLKAFHMALYPHSWGFDYPIKVGFYFPEMKGIGRIVRDRVQPMLESCPDLVPFSREQRQDMKPIGASTLYFLYMGGKSTKDSVPLNALFFDEVRLVSLDDINQSYARVLHSHPFKYKHHVSTAGYPQCLGRGTLVSSRHKITQEIVSRPIEDFTEQGFLDWQVLSISDDGESFMWKDVLAAQKSGVAKTIEIEFISGDKIRCTPEHPFVQKGEGLFLKRGGVQYAPASEMETLVRIKGWVRRVEEKPECFMPSVSVQTLTKDVCWKINEGIEEEVFDIQVDGEPCFVLAESGCLVHNSDIHKLFLNTDRKWYHTFCQRCGKEQILAQDFPECIREPAPHSKDKRYFYVCKYCKGEIVDAQIGSYIPENPGHEYSGYHISQLISHQITPREIIDRYRDTTDMKGFYNDILGLPWVDAKNKPVSMDALPGFVNPMLEWGAKGGGPYFAGIDQMMGYNYMWVIERPSPKLVRIVWFEIIEDEKPFHRCGQLMEEYDVKFCVTDGMPNSTDALEFANSFKKKVFMAFSGEYRDAVTWEDKHKTKDGHKRATPETFTRYKALFDSYKSMNHTLSMLGGGHFEWPDPRTHMIECHPYNGGRKAQYPIMLTHAYPHLASAVREQIIMEEETGKSRMRFNYIGMDPHALHALNFALWASERKTKGFSFSM